MAQSWAAGPWLTTSAGFDIAESWCASAKRYIAIDIARFMPVEEFTTRMEKLVGIIKSTPAAPGYDEVLVAGEPEWRTEAARRRDGIPVAQGNWDRLCNAAASVGVTPPASSR